MKCLYTLFFTYILSTLAFFSTVLADDNCSDALAEFQNVASEITTRSWLTIDGMQDFKRSFLTLQSSTKNEPCYLETLNQIKPLITTLKENRINMLKKYASFGIKEESGTNLKWEYDILTGQTNNNYEFSDLFSNINSQIIPEIISENVNIIPVADKENRPKNNQTKPSQSQEKCSNVINQNDAVNITNVRNQGRLGLCYAYQAADLLSYRLKKIISAVSLTDSGQSIEEDLKNIKGGVASYAIANYLKKHNGLCLEVDLPSSDFQFCTDVRDYKEFLQNLYDMAKTYQIRNNQCLQKNLNAAFPNISFNALQSFVNKNGSNNLVEYIYDLECKNKSFTGIKVETVTRQVPTYKKSDMFDQMNSLLTSGEIVGYDLKLELLEKGGNNSGLHSTIIVGRRKNPTSGACEYLMRNSWGKDCSMREDSKLFCHKSCDDNEDNCTYSGNMWVNESRLKEAMAGITYLK